MKMSTAPQAGAWQPEREGWGDLGRRLWSSPYRRALAWAAPVLLLAYGFAMTNFTLAGDDWVSLFPDSALDSHNALVAGRWLMPVIWSVADNNAFVPFFSFTLALALIALTGLVAASVWQLARSWAIFTVVALFAVNPLFSDVLSTKPAHISTALALLCATLAGWVVLRWRAAPGWRVTAAAGFLVLSLASYQPTALAFAAVVIGWEVRKGAALGPGYWREAVWRWLELLGVMVVGVAVYWLSVRVAWWATGTDPLSARPEYRLTGGYPSTLGEIAQALRYGLRMVGRFWSEGTTLYPLALKVVNLGLVAAGVGAALTAVGRARGERSRRVRGVQAWLLALGVASLVVPFVTLFMRVQPSIRASVLTSVGLVVGFWAALSLEQTMGAGRGAGRRLAGVVVTVLVLVSILGSAHQINQGYFGLSLANRRDLANANRMLSVMEQMREFGTSEEIQMCLVGRVQFYVSAEPFSHAVPRVPGVSIVGCSGLACQNHLVSMFNLIGGGSRAFILSPVPRGPTAQAVIQAMPAWPEPGSIRFLEGVFVIKGS